MRLEIIHVLLVHYDKYTFIWKARFEFRIPGFLEHGDGGQLTPAFLLSCPAPCCKLRGFRRTHVDLVVWSILGKLNQMEAPAGPGSQVPRVWQGSTGTWRRAGV